MAEAASVQLSAPFEIAAQTFAGEALASDRKWLPSEVSAANGAAEVAFGRNLRGAADPAAMAVRLRRALHGKGARA